MLLRPHSQTFACFVTAKMSLLHLSKFRYRNARHGCIPFSNSSVIKTRFTLHSMSWTASMNTRLLSFRTLRRSPSSSSNSKPGSFFKFVLLRSTSSSNIASISAY
uniref:(northern house mosquito) hypothetical protein n=1 Tax=Culex pipiens TaxID=7175 RepID=A0A8D8NBZ1_CULPI